MKGLSTTSTRELLFWIPAESLVILIPNLLKVGLIEPILHKFEDLKIYIFF